MAGSSGRGPTIREGEAPGTSFPESMLTRPRHNDHKDKGSASSRAREPGCRQSSVMGHHYIPQRYLVNFHEAGRPRWIWLHDRKGGTPRPAPIDKVAQISKFYTPEMERHLATEVELPANKVIEKLLDSKRIDSDERRQLAFYIGAMIQRVPRHRQRMAAMVPEVLATSIADIRNDFRTIAAEGHVDRGLIARRLSDIERIYEAYSRKLPHDLVQRFNTPLPSDTITAVLGSMTWRMLISSGPQYFVTTDNPAFFFRGQGYAAWAMHPSEISFSVVDRPRVARVVSTGTQRFGLPRGESTDR